MVGIAITTGIGKEETKIIGTKVIQVLTKGLTGYKIIIILIQLSDLKLDNLLKFVFLLSKPHQDY